MHSQSSQKALLIRDFLQAACSTSRITTLQYTIKPEDYPTKPLFVASADNVAHCLFMCVGRRGRPGARPCHCWEGHQITVADFGLAELDVAKRDFGGALPSVFYEVGVT